MIDVVLLSLVIGAIGFRAGRAVAMDDIGEPIRRTARNYASDDPRQRHRRWLVGLTKCPHCIGFWLTIIIGLIVCAILADFDWATDAVIIAAATGVQSLLSTYAQKDQIAVTLEEPTPEAASETGHSDTVPP